MGDDREDGEDMNDSSSDSFIDDTDNDEPLISGQNDGLNLEVSVTDEDIEDLIAELLDVESRAAEAQEALEDESLRKVEVEVREELAQSLKGDDLEKAVAEEMSALKEEWEDVLDDLETESAQLLEQLDGAGVELPRLYKWIESQNPAGCCTEAWKNRTHWVGSQVNPDVTESVADAEKYLQTHRPVRRQHGRILEEGASGFLGKRLATDDGKEAVKEDPDIDWGSFNKIFSSSADNTLFGSKNWASVYLASTPQQAAELGLKFPGVDEVEEIDDIEGSLSDPFLADAIVTENELYKSEEQKRNFKKVKEEDDAYFDRKLLLRLKQKRQRKRCKQEDGINSFRREGSSSNRLVEGNSGCTVNPGSISFENDKKNDIADQSELSLGCRKNPPVTTINSDDDEDAAEDKCMHSSTSEMVDQFTVLVNGDATVSSISNSESDSDDWDGSASVLISARRRRKKKIRRILDDAELGEETKRKIAIEKERQERLKILEAKYSTKSMGMGKISFTGTVSEGAAIDMLGDAAIGYIVNVVREEGEEAVRIPSSISTKLKAHQIAGIRFMWENIIQSIRKAKAGDKGLGCILAHTMGLGKTLQVIAFLYAALRSADIGLKTALIVTPVNVLHNWRHEFVKWRPSELKPLRIYMLEDVSSNRRAELLMKWRAKGGVFLIGYTAFRNLSLGRHVKDRHIAKVIRNALQDGPDILVCDEAHMIKNTRADTTQALKLVKCQRRIALTGSPLQNNLMEYFCMVDFVREGFLGSSQEFRNRFQNPIENGQHTNSTSDDVKIMNQRSHILYEQLKGFVQRMDMNVVKKDLPPKTVFVIAVKLSPLQRKLYRRFLDVHGFTNDKVSTEKSRKNFFAGYQALAQIWNHPAILKLMKDKDFSKRDDVVENFLAVDSSSDDNLDYNMVGERLRQKKNDNGFLNENWWYDLLQGNEYEAENSGKMVLLLDILSMCSDVGDKALVFSQSISTLDLIEQYLSKLTRPGRKQKHWKHGKDWYRIDGRTEGSVRQKLVERFNDSSNKRVKCTLISTRAGSLGINLHAANRVIIVDGSWNPTYDLQAIYRAWRYGQTKPVFAYRLMAYGTMEEKIYKRQVTKESLSARVVDRQQVHRTISKEEMLHLFAFGDDENPGSFSELKEQDGNLPAIKVTDHIGNSSKQKEPLHQGTFSSDKVMQSLLGRHYPRWIANYHEHETLLQENEDEKLSKEEQDMAWEVYRRTLEREEMQKLHHDESTANQNLTIDETLLARKSSTSNIAVNEDELERNLPTLWKKRSRNQFIQRKCTNLSHLLTLRSQGTKIGGSTVCGECAQEISWEDLKRESKPLTRSHRRSW